MTLPDTVSFTIRISRFTWRELWSLSGHSLQGMVLLLPCKLFGSTKLDRVHRINFKQPIGVGNEKPHISNVLVHHFIRQLEEEGFSFWGAAEVIYYSGTILSYKRACILAQIAYIGEHQPFVNLVSFTTPRPTITANSESGIHGGNAMDKVVLWGASIRHLLVTHTQRISGHSLSDLDEVHVSSRYEEAARKAFEYNLARGVYKMQTEG